MRHFDVFESPPSLTRASSQRLGRFRRRPGRERDQRLQGRIGAQTADITDGAFPSVRRVVIRRIGACAPARVEGFGDSCLPPCSAAIQCCCRKRREAEFGRAVCTGGP